MAEVLTIKLTGIAGVCKGSEFVLHAGGEAVIGRSRDAGFRIAAGKAGDDDGETGAAPNSFKGTGEKEKHVLTVSGHHAKLSFKDAKHIYIEDLSKHGTFLDGKPIQGRDQIVGLGKGPLELRLGTNETLRMELIRTFTDQPKITVKRPA